MSNPSPGSFAQHDLLSRYWAVSFVVLLAVSYALWLPPAWTSTEYYPVIGLVRIPAWLSDGVAIGLLPVLLIGCSIAFVADRWPERSSILRRIGWFIVAASLLLGFLADQHRLQPWAYQSLLYATLFGLLPIRSMPVAMRIITISIYFYSSQGKFDYQFLHTVGQDFLKTTLSWLPFDVEQWDLKTRLYAAACFPVSELAVAVLLAIPRTRLIGGCLAITMHASLMLILSPLGMNHSTGVLAWNAVLAGQAYLLFIRPNLPNRAVGSDSVMVSRVPSLNEETSRFTGERSGIAAAVILIALAILLPLTERRDRRAADAWHWDHWLSWALYSPHNSRVQVEIHASLLGDMPGPLLACVADDTNGDSWHELDLGMLSLRSRGVPILPQSRYQLRLAIALARSQNWTHQIRAVLRSSSDRFDGTRREQWLDRIPNPLAVAGKSAEDRNEVVGEATSPV